MLVLIHGHLPETLSHFIVSWAIVFLTNQAGSKVIIRCVIHFHISYIHWGVFGSTPNILT